MERIVHRFSYNHDYFFSSFPKNSRIPDLVYSVGHLEYYLLNRDFINLEVVDLSKEQIEIGKLKLDELEVSNDDIVNFIERDAIQYLRTISNFDAIILIDIIEHFPKSDVIELLDFAYKALNPGGYIFVRTPNAESSAFGRFYDDFTHHTPFTVRSIQQCFKLYGFSIFQIGYERYPNSIRYHHPIRFIQRFMWVRGNDTGKISRN